MTTFDLMYSIVKMALDVYSKAAPTFGAKSSVRAAASFNKRLIGVNFA